MYSTSKRERAWRMCKWSMRDKTKAMNRRNEVMVCQQSELVQTCFYSPREHSMGCIGIQYPTWMYGARATGAALQRQCSMSTQQVGTFTGG